MKERDKILQEIMFGLWRIWKCKNELVFSGVMVHLVNAIKIWGGHIREYRDVVFSKLRGEKPRLKVKNK